MGCGALPHTPAGSKAPAPHFDAHCWQEGKALQPFPSSSNSVLGSSRVKVKLRGRLRRTLTLHRAADELHRSSHDAAERGARGTAGAAPPRIRSAQGEALAPCSVSSSISYPDRGRGSPCPSAQRRAWVKRAARGAKPLLLEAGGLAPARGGGDSVPTNLEGSAQRVGLAPAKYSLEYLDKSKFDGKIL